MSYKKLYSFRLPIELMEKLRDQADQKDTSVTQLVVGCIEAGLAHEPGSQTHLSGDRSHALRTALSSPRHSNPEELSETAEIKHEITVMRQEIDSLKKEILRAPDRA
ncbi:MAG: hypothetical protein AAF651_03775 [Cyanobacteria bacterium P01_C01_bin.73]